MNAQSDAIEALLNSEVDAIVEDMLQAEYLIRSKALKGVVSVTGEPFWMIDVAVAVSRPGGGEHPIKKLLTTIMLEMMRGRGRGGFEANRLGHWVRVCAF